MANRGLSRRGYTGKEIEVETPANEGNGWISQMEHTHLVVQFHTARGFPDRALVTLVFWSLQRVSNTNLQRY